MKRDSSYHPDLPVCVPCSAALALLASLTACGPAALSNGVRQEIGAQVLKQRRPITACYRQALKRNAALSKADLTLVFTVDHDSGAFNDVSVRDAGGGPDPLLQQCVVRRTQGLRVAQAPDKPVVVNYPLRFSVKRK